MLTKKKLTPPKYLDLLKTYQSELGEILMTELPSNFEGKYLHWHEVTNRGGNEKLNHYRWLKLKFSRTYIPISLYDENNIQFRYTLPNQCHALLHHADSLRADLSAYYEANKKTKSEFLTNSLKLEEPISSSQLEGAATTRVVALAMLESERAPTNSDEKMILNNFHLMNEVIKNKDQPLSIELILKFHEIATLGIDDVKINPGVFRSDNNVYVSNRDGDKLHIPPSHELLEQRINNLCTFANSEHKDSDFIHPIIKAIILHFMLGYEHPFYDGNGRTARALFYWYLAKNGYDEFQYISISKLLKVAPKQYAMAYLYSETDDNDLTYFILYQLKIIVRAIKELFSYLDKKKKEFIDTLSWLDQTTIINTLNAKEIILLKKAIENPGKIFTVKEVRNHFGIADNTARKYLDNLVNEKVLFKSKTDSGSLYISRQDIVNIINQKR